MSYSIAIDGPAGAGKSTVAKAVAGKLKFIYVDTGAMYRAMALYLIRRGITKENTDGISSLCKDADISIEYRNAQQIVLLGEEDVGGLIRTEEVSNMASVSSANPDVRIKLVELQRQLALKSNVVMDGRDIGTHVLPDADVKIYLTASSEVRAKRRYDELVEKGEACDLAEIERDIIERDRRDMTREFSPLRQADDAVLLDSSNMGVHEVIDRILGLVRESGIAVEKGMAGETKNGN